MLLPCHYLLPFLHATRRHHATACPLFMEGRRLYCRAFPTAIRSCACGRFYYGSARFTSSCHHHHGSTTAGFARNSPLTVWTCLPTTPPPAAVNNVSLIIPHLHPVSSYWFPSRFLHNIGFHAFCNLWRARWWRTDNSALVLAPSFAAAAPRHYLLPPPTLRLSPCHTPMLPACMPLPQHATSILPASLAFAVGLHRRHDPSHTLLQRRLPFVAPTLCRLSHTCLRRALPYSWQQQRYGCRCCGTAHTACLSLRYALPLVLPVPLLSAALRSTTLYGLVGFFWFWVLGNLDAEFAADG